MEQSSFQDIHINGSKIVIVDDSKVVTKKLEELLLKTSDHEFRIFTAYNGKDGKDLIEQVCPDLIIMDIDMPQINGLALCRMLREIEATRITPIIILTASDTPENRSTALTNGANDIVSKSADYLELKLRVESQLRLKMAAGQLEQAANIISSLAKAVEVKDIYTKGHAERVSSLSEKMAGRVGFNRQQKNDMIMAGLLHDIGKIGVPDGILNKPGILTQEEMAVIKKHPVTSYEICLPIRSFEHVRESIKHHHEKLDGSGYPDGLSGDSINLETRILTVADIYDAVTSTRSYRGLLTMDQAMKLLNEMVGKHEIDGDIVDVLKSVIP
jgi:putative two-component system response regulator